MQISNDRRAVDGMYARDHYQQIIHLVILSRQLHHSLQHNRYG